MSYGIPDVYLPHRNPMIMLESVQRVDEHGAQCRVSVAAEGVLSSFLNQDGSLPAWFASEMMAQTVGVWSGWHCLQRGDPEPAMGMVLAIRDLWCEQDVFLAGSVLDIYVSELMQDGRFGSFEGHIECQGQRLASGRLSTFQPRADELAVLFRRPAA